MKGWAEGRVLQYWNDKSFPARFWKRPSIRRELQLLMRARQRRRTWRLLEGNAGEASGWVRSMLQVRYSISFQWRSYFLLSILRKQQWIGCCQNWNIFQRPGSCLSPSFLLLWPTQSLPLSSTTLMDDFNSFVSMIWKDINKYFNNNSTTSQQLLYRTSKVIHFNF